MATSTELVQSILAALAKVQNSDMSEGLMFHTGVIDTLMEMDELASELVEVLE